MTTLQIAEPKPIIQFLDDLAAAGQHIVPDSLIWIPDPNRPRREIAAVMIVEPPAPTRPNPPRYEALYT